jgi:peptidyl-prolyl cis-trans isomerase D
MLQNMRDGAQKWVVWVIIGFLVIAMTFWGISSYFTGFGSGDNSDPVAKVNGVVITESALDSSFNRLHLQQPQLFTQSTDTDAIKKLLLQNMIQQAVLAQMASDENFMISQDQLDALIEQIPAFQMGGKFSTNQFNAVLNQLFFTPQQFVQDVQQKLLISQVKNGLSMSVFSLPNEVNSFVTLSQQTRNFGYFVIPVSQFMNTIKISPADIQTYYEKNSAMFQTPEMVSINYIEITPASVSAQLQPTQQDLMGYYQDNISNYSTPMRWHVAHILLNIPADATPEQLTALQQKLAGIRAQAEKGISFATLASQNSQDILTASQGGDMPWFAPGTLNPTFEKTVASLKPGQISQPVQTAYGMELIKLIAVQPQVVQPFAAVVNKVTADYKSQQIQLQMSNVNEDLANITFENPNTLAPAVKKFNTPMQSTALFTQSGLTSGIAANPDVISAAFSNSVIAQNNNSNVITLKDGTLIVLRVNQHIPAGVKPLQDVSAGIQKTLLLQQATAQAQNLGVNLLKQIQAGQISPVKAAATNEFNWLAVSGAGRKSTAADAQIIKQAFDMARPSQTNPMPAAGFVMSNGNYAIVAVSKVNDVQLKMVPAAQQASVGKDIENFYGDDMYQSYMNAAMDKYSIKQYKFANEEDSN